MAITATAAGLTLCMFPPPLGGKRRDHGDGEIDQRSRRAPIYGWAEVSLEFEFGGVSTFRKAQKYNTAMPS
jgi:hypothetical protein